MKEIKFRAWNKELKLIIYPDILILDNNKKQPRRNRKAHLSIGDYLPNYNSDGSENFPNIHNIQKICLNNIILMQYTGLKDKNGKEIYEGDIVEFTNPDEKKHIELVTYVEDVNYGGGNVEWENISNDENRYCFNPLDFSGYVIKWYQIEIIGNIHENPELIKER